MSDQPDSSTNGFESIDVFDTPQHDNPRFGSVTLRMDRGQMAQTVRMTRHDAENLMFKLSEYLYPQEMSN